MGKMERGKYRQEIITSTEYPLNTANKDDTTPFWLFLL